jgi:hypothetical protein
MTALPLSHEDDLQAVDDLTALATALSERGYHTRLDPATPPSLAITHPDTPSTHHVSAENGFYCWDNGFDCPGNHPRHLPFCDREPGAVAFAAEAVTLLMTFTALHQPEHAGTR